MKYIVNIFYLKSMEMIIKIRLGVNVLHILWSLCKIIFKNSLEVFSMSTLF